MKAIDLYVLRNIVPTVLIVLFIAAVILCMERLMRLLDIAVGNGVSTLVVFQMLFNLIPYYIGLALPVALFLGVLLAFRKLSLQSNSTPSIPAASGSTASSARPSCSRP
jgi:lipopolysaccharide export system permease protein